MCSAQTLVRGGLCCGAITEQAEGWTVWWVVEADATANSKRPAQGAVCRRYAWGQIGGKCWPLSVGRVVVVCNVPVCVLRRA
jgi:hypothetical protein